MSISLVCDLRSRFGEVRDQEARPTCMAFATSDAHGACFDTFRTLSVEYLYYYAVQLTPGRDPHAGVSPHSASRALANSGQPVEGDWPYQSILPTNIGNWKPPINCSVFKRLSSASNKGFDEICLCLDSGKPVIVCMQLTESFHFVESSGLIDPKSPDSITGNHAVIAVGHGQTANKPCLMIRNSWGSSWGAGGYAFLEKKYLTKQITSAFVLK